MAGWLNRKAWCFPNNCKSDRSTINHQAIQPSSNLKIVIDLFGHPLFTWLQRPGTCFRFWRFSRSHKQPEISLYPSLNPGITPNPYPFTRR
jgi:hypothetical protein